MRNSYGMSRMAGMAALIGVILLAGCMLFQPEDVVDFDATPVSGVKPHLVDFAPIVEGPAVAYRWDFGDGETSTEATPAHIYRVGGTFTVSLSVQFADGDVSNVIKADLIEVAEKLGKAEPYGPIVWLDRSEGKIYSGARFGGTISTVVSGIYQSEQIAVGGDKVYWTADKKIERANLDGSGRKTIFFDADMTSPVGIAVDSVAGEVYWVWGPAYVDEQAAIWRSDLDGSDARSWVSRTRWASRSYGPWLLAVDSVNHRLYWYEMYFAYEGVIVPASGLEPLTDESNECSVHWTDLSDFSDHTAFEGLPESKGLALDVGLAAGARYLYWTEPSTDAIWFGYPGESHQSMGLKIRTDAPHAVAIDADEGKMYWSSSDGIHRANLWDGSERELIYPGVKADALALDI
jgi:PKD repeat protein